MIGRTTILVIVLGAAVALAVALAGTAAGTGDAGVPGTDIGDVTVNNAAGAAAVNVQDGGNALTVDSAQLPAALVDGLLGVTVGIISAAPLTEIGPGIEATALRVTLAADSTGQVSVEGSAGTAAQQGAGAATAATFRITQSTDDAGVTSLAALDDLVRGEDAAHASLDSGVMALAVHSDTAQTLAGTDGDYAPPVITRLGAVRAAMQPEAYIDSLGAYYLVQTAFTTVTTAGAEEIQPVAAQGAGNSIVLLDWIVSTDTAINVQFESDDSDAGITVRVYLAANGGWTSDHAAAWGETADNQALKLQVSAAATVSVQVRYLVR